MDVFTSSATVLLTSTTSSQTTVVPSGSQTMAAYNAAANPVYMRFAASVAAPTSTWGDVANSGIMCVQPGTTQVFSIPVTGGTLAYIATTAGGTLVLSIGDGA